MEVSQFDVRNTFDIDRQRQVVNGFKKHMIVHTLQRISGSLNIFQNIFSKLVGRRVFLPVQQNIDIWNTFSILVYNFPFDAEIIYFNVIFKIINRSIGYRNLLKFGGYLNLLINFIGDWINRVLVILNIFKRKMSLLIGDFIAIILLGSF